MRNFILLSASLLALLAAPPATAFGSICEEGIGGRVDVCVSYETTQKAVYAPDPYTTGNRDEVCVSQNTCVTYPEVAIGEMYVTSVPGAKARVTITINNCRSVGCEMTIDTDDLAFSTGARQLVLP